MGEIRGTVTDSEKGTLLIGANVVIVGTQFGSSTNLDGAYSIKGIPPGRYSVLVRFVGYRQQTKDVAVPGTDDYDNAAVITAAESNQQLFQGGFYIAENIGLFDRIFLDLGLRVDGNSAFGKDAGVCKPTFPFRNLPRLRARDDRRGS